jgi:hypothetical protein
MIPAQSQSVALSGAGIGASIVGHWIVEANLPGRVALDVSQPVPAQENPLNSTGGQLLRCRWVMRWDI